MCDHLRVRLGLVLFLALLPGLSACARTKGPRHLDFLVRPTPTPAEPERFEPPKGVERFAEDLLAADLHYVGTPPVYVIRHDAYASFEPEWTAFLECDAMRLQVFIREGHAIRSEENGTLGYSDCRRIVELLRATAFWNAPETDEESGSTVDGET